jgi:hypothetical protein
MGVRRDGNAEVLLTMALAVLVVATTRAAQRGDAGATVKFATPTPPAPLFFREDWRQPSPFDASTNFEPERPVTQAAGHQCRSRAASLRSAREGDRRVCPYAAD